MMVERRVHPKWYGLAVAGLFFGLAYWTLVVEATLSQDPGLSLLYSGLRTLFAFLGGAGFTAFLSMHIYEYVTARNQARGWKHEFDVDKVRDLYGPLYDELKRAEQFLDEEYRLPKLGQTELLRQRYMSLLIPETLLQRGQDLLGEAIRYRKLHKLAIVKLNNIAENTTRQYVQSVGGSGNFSLNVANGEWQYIFGATLPSFEENYDRLVQIVAEQLPKQSLSKGSVDEFEIRLKAALMPLEEGRQLRVLRDELKEIIAGFVADLEPLIRTPYKE